MSERHAFELDAALALRELAREYADINWGCFGSRLLPLPLLLSDNLAYLGRFTSDPRQIELSRALVVDQPWGAVIEVLKHEMAHQFVAEVLRELDEPSHGPAFQRICERLGIDARASGLPAGKPARSAILERIRKLFALAGSSNEHEAENAMRMAHRLMLRHNLDYAPGDAQAAGNDDYSFRHIGRATGRILEAERLLAGLLGEFFFVQPIWVSVYRVTDRKRASMLEITGRHENLEMAEYVHGFLVQASESLWRAHKQKHGIRSNADRRAFLAGVMRGFAEKLRAERKSEEATGLIWVEDPLAARYFQRRHPRVRSASYGSSANHPAATHGRAAGRDLVLNRPLARGSSSERRALPASTRK